MELKNCHDIIRSHYNNVIIQDGRNKVEFGRTETKFPTSFNTKQYVVCTKIILNFKPVGKSSVNDTN